MWYRGFKYNRSIVATKSILHVADYFKCFFFGLALKYVCWMYEGAAKQDIQVFLRICNLVQYSGA